MREQLPPKLQIRIFFSHLIALYTQKYKLVSSKVQQQLHFQDASLMVIRVMYQNTTKRTNF